MNEELNRLWQQAEEQGEADIGEIVVCDFCDREYTNSEEKGGLLFQSRGICPVCTPKMLKDAELYGEERFIRAVANDGETFKAFILRIRGGNNKIKIGPISKKTVFERE